MIPIDVSNEIKFRTARSGGSGGQNVNKVESMVEGLFNIERSGLLDDEQKSRIASILHTKINGDGYLQVRSQVHRSQLENKLAVIEKINLLVNKSLHQPKKRIATKPGKMAKARRVETKKKSGEIKQGRRKIRNTDY